jgi:hypothetical protein
VTLTVSPAGSGTLAGADVIGTNTSSAPAGAGEAYRITAATTGSATRLRLYVDASTTATKLQLGLYADSGGNPSSLLGFANATSVTKGAWNEVTLSTPISLTAGTAYWFALLNPSGSGGTLFWRDHAGGTGGAEQTSAGRTMTDLPLTWSTLGRYSDGPVSGYALGAPAPPPSPVLSTTPSSLSFSATAGSSNPAAKGISVSNAGGGTLNWTASDDAAWMSVSPTSGTNAGTVNVSVDISGLSTGTYNGNVTVDAGSAGVKTIPVTLTVNPPAPPALALSKTSLSYSAQTGAGNPASQTFTVSNTGGGSLSYTASDDAAWMSETPTSGSAPDTVSVAVDTTGLAAGTYTGTVTVNAGAAGTKTVAVTLTLTSPPPAALAVSPTSLSFSATQGGSAPPAQGVAVSNTGSGTLPFTVSDDAAWLSESPTSGTANTTVNVTADPAGLAPGTYTGTVTINGGAAGTKTVSVSFAVTAPATGLVGAWGFEESTGTTTADASGKGNTGTINGPVRTTSGKFGSALTFDGINDWVTVNDSASLDLTTGMTVEGWAYPTAAGSASVWRAMAIKETANGLAWGLYPFGDAGLPSGHALTSSEQWARGTSALPLNAWSHVAVTYDGTTIRMYVNGTQVGTKAQTGSLRVSSQPLRFGGDALWPEWFQGRLDEIRVYNRALTTAEIQGDMGRAVSSLAPARLGAGLLSRKVAKRSTARVGHTRAGSKKAHRHRARGKRRHARRHVNPGVQHIHYRARHPHARRAAGR